MKFYHTHPALWVGHLNKRSLHENRVKKKIDRKE